MNNNENRPEGSHRVYITDGPPRPRQDGGAPRTAPRERPGAYAPAAPRDRTLNVVLLLAFILFGIVLITFITVFALSSGGRYTKGDITSDPGVNAVATPAPTVTVVPETTVPVTETDAADIAAITGINSEYAVLVEADTGRVIAAHNADTVMYPASLTKIMTLVVAREHIADTSATVTFTRKMLYSLDSDAMKVGYQIGETANALDLMYGAMLPSGCDATVGLAYLCAEDEDAFAGLMNAKANELGLRRTHFSNSSGLFDSENYTTVHDLAVIFGYALKDELMRKIICTETYTTAGDGKDPATQHRLNDRLFYNMKEYDGSYGAVKLKGFTVLGGKTGYVDESGSCLASYSVAGNGKRYIVITGKGRNMALVLADHYNILMKYAK